MLFISVFWICRLTLGSLWIFYFGGERLGRFRIRERLRLISKTKEKDSPPNYSITFRDILSKIKYRHQWERANPLVPHLRCDKLSSSTETPVSQTLEPEHVSTVTLPACWSLKRFTGIILTSLRRPPLCSTTIFCVQTVIFQFNRTQGKFQKLPGISCSEVLEGKINQASRSRQRACVYIRGVGRLEGRLKGREKEKRELYKRGIKNPWQFFIYTNLKHCSLYSWAIY